MIACFADTSYFIALLSPGDVNHARALAIADSLRRTVFTSEYVVLEVGSLFRSPVARPRFARFMQVIGADRDTTIVPATSALLRKAIEMFVTRPDKSWSLTDCTSFVIMQDHGMTDVLSTDHHFNQAGFRALLRTEPK